MTNKKLDALCRKVANALVQVVRNPYEITDEQAILHLQSTGWMQNHDREMYEQGLKEQLADDSGSYDALIPCEDAISRRAAIDAIQSFSCCGYIEEETENIVNALKELSSAQPERPEQPESAKEYCAECDHIEMCRWYPYEGCEFRSLSSAQPEQRWIPCSKRLPDKDGRYWVWAENFVVPDHVDGPETYQGSTEASFLNGRWWGNVGKVYAWMPLPKPYKPQESED